GLTLKDASGRYVLVNAAMLSRYGGTVDEFIGKKSSEVRYFPGDLAVALEEEDERVIAGGRTMIMPIREVHYPDGTTRIRRFIKIPMKDDHGRPSGVMTASEDITQQVFAERELLRSKALLQTIFDTIPMDIQVKDAESRIVTMNKRMLENFKLTEADVVGRHAPAPVSATDLERILAADRQVMASGRTFEEVQHRVMADGSRRHYRILKSPLREGSGKVTGVVGVAEDITVRVNAEMESQRSKALLQTVFDTIPLDILVKDQECHIVAMNKRMLRSFDLKDGEFNGRYTPVPVSEHEMAAILNTDRTVMATGRSTDEIHHRTMPDGSRRHYRVIKSALRDEAGKSFGVVGIAEDITERLASDAALQRSRALLQAVFDTIPHDVWVKDRDARYVQANRQLLQTFGTTMEAIAGRPNAMPASPAEMETITRSDMAVIRSGQTSDLINSRTFPDGSVHQFRVIKTPLRDETGQVAGLVGIAEDVTDRMRSERELRENRLLLQAVFDALPLWVFVKSPESKIVMVNKQMATDYGMDPVGVVTLTSNDPADQDTQEQARALDVQALNSDGPVEITDYRHTIRGQPTRLLRSVRKAIRDANGVPTLIVGISEDITEKRRAEQALLQTQKLESLGILAGGIAHDFNNLLTGILGNVELALLELEGEHHARPPLNNVKNASLMAAGLTRQMLAYSGGGRFELRPILLNALVEDMAQLLRVTVPRHVNVVYRFEPNLPLVEADASQLQQVIMNLITNASEAMGDRPGDVVLTTGVAHATREELATYHLAGDVAPGDYVLLQVSDSGSGMAPGTLQRIFDPFFTTKFTGRGLGLAAVLGIVRSHKGAIRVTSEQ
ncbi:MAG TPA: PAS domain-containing protein, partial [bacterium]